MVRSQAVCDFIGRWETLLREWHSAEKQRLEVDQAKRKGARGDMTIDRVCVE